MKKLASWMVCILMACCCFSVCACGEGSETPPPSGPTTESGAGEGDGGQESVTPEKDENGGNWTEEMPLN